MKDVKYIVFDFDGTIADTLDQAFMIYNRIAPEYNCRPIEKGDREMIRAKQIQKLLKAYGVTNLNLFLILLRIRKELSRIIPETEVIKGIRDSIYEMKNAGFKLGILTTNSTKNVSKFLENNDLTGIIDFIYSGKNLFGKDRVIRRLLDIEKISRGSVIYVGDETRDIEACKKAGIPVIAVSWGLNRRELLSSLSPDQIADDPKELFGCVQRIFNKNFV